MHVMNELCTDICMHACIAWHRYVHTYNTYAHSCRDGQKLYEALKRAR